MSITRLLQALAISVASLVGAAAATAQSPTVAPNVGSPRITAFNPMDSVIILLQNTPTNTQYTITLHHRLSGIAATEYRVSRFADFRDASWRPYEARPTTSLQQSMFARRDFRSDLELMLHLQVRARNAQAGRPVSLVDGRAAVQPDFYFSEVVARRIVLRTPGG